VSESCALSVPVSNSVSVTDLTGNENTRPPRVRRPLLSLYQSENLGVKMHSTGDDPFFAGCSLQDVSLKTVSMFADVQHKNGAENFAPLYEKWARTEPPLMFTAQSQFSAHLNL
jgi:hypothetical protein